MTYGIASGSYSTTVSGILTTSYTVTGLTAGVTYKFKVLSRNSYAVGAYSTDIEVLAAQIPDTPIAPSTTISATNVTLSISWTAPNAQGSPILGYMIYIRTSDGVTFTSDQTNCNGANSVILANAQCSIPISTLRSSVYNLPWGSSVWAKVVAYNLYGNSVVSPAGNGAVILTLPDAPTTLAETVSQRSSTSITFSWVAGPTNGGAPVLDYRVNYD